MDTTQAKPEQSPAVRSESASDIGVHALNAANLFSVRGLVALITGGGSGIGYMIAKALALNGAQRVYIVGRRQEVLQAAATSIGKPGVVVPLYCDVTSKVSLESLVNIVRQDVGFLNVLFCNAGVGGPYVPQANASQMSLQQWVDMNWGQSLDDFNNTLKINVTAVWYTSMAFLPLLDLGNKQQNVEQTSQIIATSSIAGINKMAPGGTAYGLSKAALTHLIKQLAVALPQWGIRANCIAPGLFPSEMADPIIDRAGGTQSIPIPLGRIGTEEDMAGVVLYLASKAGAYCNGNMIIADGGRISCFPSTF